MFSPEDYTIIAHILPRLYGLIFLFAIAPFLFQIQGLIGANGILPAAKFLALIKARYPQKYYYYVPTLFWINSSNWALVGLVWSGVVLSIALMLGFYPSLLLFLLYLIYLSIVSVGQDFLSFGWEGFLLEGAIYTFLISLTPTPTLMSWICINILLFRFYFHAGLVKLQSGDQNWRNLTAIFYHYQSQPLPNAAAWYIHKLPLWFHKASVILMFAIELAVPFGIFGPDLMRTGVFAAFFFLQWSVWATGNFSYLNHLSVILSTILLNNSTLSSFIPPPTMELPVHGLIEEAISTLAGGFILMQLMQIWRQLRLSPSFHYSRFQRWLMMCSFYHIANPYGIFAVMTTTRIEIIIEGSDDGEQWKEYAFPYKPSEVERRPRRISPYQPRLDWQAWFLPFDSIPDAWFEFFLFHLLKGTPEVLRLLRTNPFPHHPPKYVRAMKYDYRFSTFAEKRQTGHWWVRNFAGPFCPAIMLRNWKETG